MCALARPAPTTLVIDLSQRLAEDYPDVPLTEVSRVVKRAAAASLPVADTTRPGDLASAFVTIERRSRNSLRRRNSQLRGSESVRSKAG
jgi:hypothetical protein